MAQIRPTQARDVLEIADLHHAAMGESLWARVGLRFLRTVYRALIDDERFLSFVYQEDGTVRGFIAGSLDTDAMMRETLRRAWPALAMAAVPGALKPAVLSHIFQTRRYADASGGAPMPESLFCSFEPALRGRRISGHINKVLFDELLARGHGRVKITTEVDNEGANRQLRSWGFEDAARFRFYGKDMVRYELDLEASERVEPVSRHPAV
jgi:RimJ/RimL family protein N-acetyltransferase